MKSIRSDKEYYITTSIAYANAEPHIGYAMELVQADVLARYHSDLGRKSYFLTGTDEHGQKLYDAAKNANKAPQAYVDELSRTFINLTELLKLSNSNFIRTTDINHKKAAQELWLACKKDIYKGQYSGLYCVGCERYYTNSEVIEDTCPVHKTKLEFLEIDSYFFALSKYESQLIKMINDEELRIVPIKRRNEMISFAKSGLSDISISRPKSQLKWGVEVPNDSDHVMYVWFDALANYISAVGYGKDKSKFNKIWPADVHVVGKDIARFHCILWPAILMSASLPTPKSIFVHGFITSRNQKISKSLGNVINPAEYVNRYGVDALRYYLLRYIPSYNDGDFTESRFIKVYNSDLANTLGNLVSRLFVMCNKYCKGEFSKKNVESIDIAELIDECKFDSCLEIIFERIAMVNASIDKNRPWELFNTDQGSVRGILDILISELLVIAKALNPFLPDTSNKISSIFNNGKAIMDKDVILFPRL